MVGGLSRLPLVILELLFLPCLVLTNARRYRLGALQLIHLAVNFEEVVGERRLGDE